MVKTKTIIFSILIIFGLFLYIDYANEQKDIEAAKNWENYRILLNNEAENIKNTGRLFDEAQGSADIQQILDILQPKIDQYELHLYEAKSFLNNNEELIPNSFELKTQLDAEITRLKIIRNQLNTFINNYNQNIESYNQQINYFKSLIDLLTLL